LVIRRRVDIADKTTEIYKSNGTEKRSWTRGSKTEKKRVSKGG